jgi:hypothetical protein
MTVAALVTWVITALVGLFLLAIWLIEYDPDFQHAAATRLPVPVVAGHALFAVGGLVSWVLYAITHERVFSLAAVAAAGLAAVLGLTLAWRWLGVYRAGQPKAAAQAILARRAAGVETWDEPAVEARPKELAVPPERHFPVPAVIAHGVLAVTTILLVVLTVLGAGGG